MKPPDLPPPAIISVRNLYRIFDDVSAVNGLTFDIYPGQVVGFIGANGAGKTTTMRMMATLEMPTSGTIEICGLDVVDHPTKVRHKIGWMPDAYGAYPNVTVVEYLDFYARAFGFKAEERARRVAEVMDFTDLASISGRMMDKLSKGMGQRLCLGRTLLHDPEVMILDEPAAGLDPKARVEFKRLIRLLAAEGKTIFISSHILSELAEMCDTMLFIDAGRIVHLGSAESLQHGEGQGAVVDVQIVGDPEAVAKWASLNAGVHLVEMKRQGARLRFDTSEEQELATALRRMINDGLIVVDFHRETRKLEEAFVDILSKIQS